MRSKHVLVSAGAALLITAGSQAFSQGGPCVYAFQPLASAAESAPKPAAAIGYTTISFGGYADGTAITNQFASKGINFSGSSPYVASYSEPSYTGSALIGNPPCHGTITGTFVDPLLDYPATVDQVSLDIDGFNVAGSTKVSVFSSTGAVISSQVNGTAARQTFSFASSNPRIASWSIQSIAEDPYGWALVSVTFDTPTNLFLIDPYLVSNWYSGTIPAASVALSVGDYAGTQALGLTADGSAAVIVAAPVPTAEPVSMLISGGATLVPFNPSFLLSAPTAGVTTLSIPASSIYTSSTGQHYALAIMQAPSAPTLSGLPQSVTVDVFAGSTYAKADIPLVPPPVILIHGLWGDQTSLQYVGQALTGTAPWTWPNAIVDPICYSKLIAFDASADPVPQGTNSCENTSVNQLVAEFDHLDNTADATHVAMGRVDIVAHSMGGLVARHFSAIPGYRGLRDRTLGLFRMIVTLDTPETGSALATFLVNNQGAPYQSNSSVLSQTIWHAAGCAGTDTLAICLGKLKMPLAGPGLPLSSGAVYSLIPGFPSIANAPSPQISNTQWRAVDAVWPDTASPGSLLRGVLNSLVGALYPSNQLGGPPTLSGILGTTQNDVIVRQDSQIAGSSAGQYATINGLEHSSVTNSTTFNSILQFTSLRDYSVLNAYSVNTVVGCWLKSSGSSTCPAMIGAALAPLNPAPSLVTAAPASWVARFRNDSRVSIELPTRRFKLAIPNQLPIHIVAGELQDVVVTQSNDQSEFSEGGHFATLTSGAGNVKMIEFTPLRLGPVDLGILVRFADGGYALQQVRVDVEPPAIAPESFLADKHATRVLTLNTTRSAILEPSAKYAGIMFPTPLDLSFVEYRVLDSDPVVSLHDGKIEALREGESTIEARYDGQVSHVKVVVKEHIYR